MMRGLLIFTLGFVAGVIGVAAPAHADDNSYLAELRANGVFMINENTWVINGHRMCDMIRSGIAPAILYDQFGTQNFQGPMIVDIAQHQLCPDTLR